jgi:hypothetical protein
VAGAAPSGSRDSRTAHGPDWDCGILPLTHRREYEAGNTPIGWHVAIYPNLNGHRGDQPDTSARQAGVQHRIGTAGQLPDLIDLTLHALANHEQHDFAEDGTHSVTYGIRHYC